MNIDRKLDKWGMSRVIIVFLIVAVLAMLTFLFSTTRRGVKHSPGALLDSQCRFELGSKVVCDGTIIDEVGKPVTGASITAYELAPDLTTGSISRFELSLIDQMITKDNGAFVLNAKAGKPTMSLVIAGKKGLALAWDHWYYLRGNKTLTIRLGKAANLAGIVVDEASRPIAGAEVRAILIAGKPPHLIAWGVAPVEELVAVTDAKGRFSFDNVPTNCKAEFLVTASGKARTMTTSCNPREIGQFTAGRTDIRITLPSEARIMGRILEKETRKPVGGLRITGRINKLGGVLEIAADVSEEDGRFCLAGLQGGDYRLEIDSTYQGLCEWVGVATTITTEAAETLSGVTVEVTKGGFLVISFLDAVSGQIVNDIELSVRHRESGQWFSAHAGTNGIAILRLPSGTYGPMNFYKYGYSTTQVPDSIEIIEGQTTQQKIQLSPAQSVEIGDKAPPFSVISFDGSQLTLDDFRGKHVLVIFWATWCGPCRGEITNLKDIYETFGSYVGFAMIGLNLDEDMEQAKEYVQKHGIRWAQGYLGNWSKARVRSEYAVHGIPTIFLIGPDGRVISKNLRGENIRKEVENVLARPQK